MSRIVANLCTCAAAKNLKSSRAPTGAIAEFREAIRLEPENAIAHFLRGWLLERKKDLRSAIEEYRKASEIDPKEPNYRGAYERAKRKAEH